MFHSSACRHSVFPAAFIEERMSLLLYMFLVTLARISYLQMQQFFPGISMLFHWLLCLLCSYHAVFVPTDLSFVFKLDFLLPLLCSFCSRWLWVFKAFVLPYGCKVL
jgi:hypothetical protein